MGRAATEKEAVRLARNAGYRVKRRQKIGPRLVTFRRKKEWAIEAHPKA